MRGQLLFITILPFFHYFYFRFQINLSTCLYDNIVRTGIGMRVIAAPLRSRITPYFIQIDRRAGRRAQTVVRFHKTHYHVRIYDNL